MEHSSAQKHDHRNIGIVSARFADKDGVSLETYKWAEVFRRMDHDSYFLAGEMDIPQGIIPNGKRLEDISRVDESFHFDNGQIKEVYNSCFGTEECLAGKAKKTIDGLKDEIRDNVSRFVDDFSIDLLVAENALTIPMNIPLGLALSEFISESNIPTIAHHHDFYWERKRFKVNNIKNILDAAFPSSTKNISNVVINSIAQHNLYSKRGISSSIIPNVMDFENPPDYTLDEYSLTFRKTFGIDEEEYIILQPTRIVRRKKIENAIDLVSRLTEKACLVISGLDGDEGNDGYLKFIADYAKEKGVKLILTGDYVNHTHAIAKDNRRIYNLRDVYLNADLVTYPSSHEGFGNALLEAVYFKKPLVVNRFSVYEQDIRPKGFKFIEINNNEIPEDTIKTIETMISSPSLVKEVTDYNYRIGEEFFSYKVLEEELNKIL